MGLEFPRWLSGKEPASVGNKDLIPGSGRSPEEGNGNSLQCSCLGNPKNKGVWWTTVHGVTRVGYNLVTKHQQLGLSQK